MNEVKTREIVIGKTCYKCPFLKIGFIGSADFCIYYKREIPILFVQVTKPDFCKVKKIVVEEEGE